MLVFQWKNDCKIAILHHNITISQYHTITILQNQNIDIVILWYQYNNININIVILWYCDNAKLWYCDAILLSYSLAFSWLWFFENHILIHQSFFSLKYQSLDFTVKCLLYARHVSEFFANAISIKLRQYNFMYFRIENSSAPCIFFGKL